MKQMNKKQDAAGFTLVEIMIVVAIIGLLSAIAIPSMAKARRESRISRMMNDLRIVYDAFNMYAMEHGDYPGGAIKTDTTPQPVADYLDGAKWDQPTVLGGRWWYIKYPLWNTSLVLIDNRPSGSGGGAEPVAPLDYWKKIDQQIDDGNLADGRFRCVGGVQVQYSLDDTDW